MHARWPLVALLGLALGAFWALRPQQDELPEQPAVLAQDEGNHAPMLQGRGPTTLHPQPAAAQRPQQPHRVTVRGRVVDAEGRPLSGAEAQTVGAEWASMPATADEEGSFTLEVLVTGAMRISVSAAGHLPWVGAWVGANGPEELDLGTVTLHPGRTIAGQVLFEDGLPAGDTRVAVVSEDASDDGDWFALTWTRRSRYAHATSDRTGHFRIDGLPAGSYTLMAAWGAWNEAILEGVRADRDDVELSIRRPKKQEESAPVPPPEQILVDVTTEDGGPVPACYAALFAGAGRWPGSQEGARISFAVPGRGDYTLYIRPEDERYASRVLRGCDVRPAPYVVALKGALTVKGVVQVDGAPVAKASVRADGWFRDDGLVEASSPPDDWSVSHATWRAETDAEGRFRIVGIAPGTVELRASSEACCQRDPVLTVDAGSGDHVIAMQANPFLAFRVHAPDGQEVGSVEAIVKRVAAGGLAWEQRVMQWGSGLGDAPRHVATFRIDVSDAGAEYAVVASNESATADGMSPLIRGLRVGDEPMDIHLQVRPPLRVTVVDESGLPVPGALVQLRRLPQGRPVLREPAYFSPQIRDSPGWPDGGHAGPDGVYTFRPSLPPGPWTVLAQGFGTAEAGRLCRVEDNQESVRVVLTRGMRLMGKVDDPEGRSQGARWVEAWPLDGQQESVLLKRLPHSGRFELTNLAQGRYVLVSRPGAAFHREEENSYAVSEPVLAGARGVRLTLHPGHRSTLDLRGLKDERLSHAEVRVVGRFVDREVVADRAGLFQAIALPPGEYIFQVQIDGRAPLSLGFKAGDNVVYRVR